MQITILKLEGRLDTTRVSEIELSFNAKAGSLKSDEEAAIIDLISFINFDIIIPQFIKYFNDY